MLLENWKRRSRKHRRGNEDSGLSGFGRQAGNREHRREGAGREAAGREAAGREASGGGPVGSRPGRAHRRRAPSARTRKPRRKDTGATPEAGLRAGHSVASAAEARLALPAKQASL